MKACPYCGNSNYDDATQCRKCDATFTTSSTATLYRSHWVSADKAREIRSKALSFLVLGLLIKVYWGGYGPWAVIDNPTLLALRTYLEPLLIYGGVAGYVVGWILNWI